MEKYLWQVYLGAFGGFITIITDNKDIGEVSNVCLELGYESVEGVEYKGKAFCGKVGD